MARATATTVTILALAWSTLLASMAFAQTQTVGGIAASPTSVAVGAATAVRVTVVITDPSVVAGSVVLQRIDDAGRVLATLQTLNDAGADGDTVAGDLTFTAMPTVYELAPGPVRLRVSAAFSGRLTRVLSAPVVISVTGTSQALVISEPGSLAFLNVSPVRVAGTVGDSGATVMINGVAAAVGGGTFTAQVPLLEGTNTLTAVATNTNGTVTTASVQVTLDTTPPRLTITTPDAAFATSQATVDVSGLVNDIVVGTVNEGQATVRVNGVLAQVSNRSFLAPKVPLTLGPNTLQAVATDQAGNSITATVEVTRTAATGARIAVVSGNLQTRPAGTVLPAALVVQVTNAANQPVANQPVVFRVMENSGGLVSGTARLGALSALTNAKGQASVQFQLGTRSGVGNNVVAATATGFAGTAVFTQSGTPTGAERIVVDTGNGQTGVAGQALALPFIAIVTDGGYNRLANVPVTFTVRQGGGTLAGKPTYAATTDSDGRVAAVLTLGQQEGFDNNVVEATFTGNKGQPAAFLASGKVPGHPSQTSIGGVVLDNSNRPIQDVTLRLYRTHFSTGLPEAVATPVQTNADGQFVMQPVPVGAFKLMADGSTAADGPWPTLEFDLVTVAGRANDVGLPIYLPRLDETEQLCVSETTGGTLRLPKVPGFALEIAPGSATFPGGSRTGCVTVTPVNGDKVPMAPGFGQQPRFVVTIQPVGTVFNAPARITLPNVDGLLPRAVTEMYSYDHDLAAFVSIGTGTVSDDGSVIRSDPGVGVIKAGWHCGGNPNPVGSAGSCPDCQKCQGTSCVADPAQNGQTCTTPAGSEGKCDAGTCKPVPSVSITAEAIDQDDPDNTAFASTGGPVYGGSTATTADNLKLTAETPPELNATSYEWSFTGPGSFPAPGSGKVWDVGDLGAVPGVVTFKVKVTFSDGQTSEATKEIDVGVRTNDIAAIGWIDPAGVPLSTAGMDADMTRYYPPDGAESMGAIQKGLTTLHLGVLAAGGTIHPVEIRGMTASERTYILNWMFKFAANFCSKNRCPPASFGNAGELADFQTTKRTSYKMFNRFQIKYLSEGGQFKGAPVVVRQATEIGVTNNPIFDFEEGGDTGPANGRFAVVNSNTAFLINDGTPTGVAVSAFNTLADPLKWSHIGSRIELGSALGTGFEVFTQVYPTYWVFENLSRVQTIPQAPAPIGNFSLTPYPPGPAPFIR